MNKKTIITILFALAIKVVGTSNALDFCIDHKDVAIAVNKDIAGNQVPDDKGTVGIATNSILMVEAKGCHIRVDGYLWRRFGILYEILLQSMCHSRSHSVPVFLNRTRHLMVSTDRAPWQTIR